jgi:hypothetical protein
MVRNDAFLESHGPILLHTFPCIKRFSRFGAPTIRSEQGCELMASIFHFSLKRTSNSSRFRPNQIVAQAHRQIHRALIRRLLDTRQFSTERERES